ncbi:MAG TPA: hypothetical protein VKV15_02295 [Bryobacteraceae bacterium]|nr:hypothetical protein [Bryobacteraceae bacterium]
MWIFFRPAIAKLDQSVPLWPLCGSYKEQSGGVLIQHQQRAAAAFRSARSPKSLKELIGQDALTPSESRLNGAQDTAASSFSTSNTLPPRSAVRV